MSFIFPIGLAGEEMQQPK